MSTSRFRRWVVRPILITILLAATVAGAAGFWLWQRVHEPFQGFTGDKSIDVSPGTPATEILASLESEGILFDADLARAFLVYRLGNPSLKAGEYRFDTPLTTPQVLERLISGRVVTYRVTLIEGMTLAETAQALADAGFGDEAILSSEMLRSDRIADLDPIATDLEGYLYPDTYHFARATPETEVVGALLRNFRKRFAAEVQPLVESSGRTIREIVTLASIVEKEARLEDERREIAGVYANRLRIGMALYADPTVIFAIKRLGRWDGNLRRPDLKLDSPYNTYVYPGLPPGPICSPRVASLTAAANPAETKHLYFVSRNDGTHVFAESLREHNRNVTRWQKQYWRERWAREKQSK